MLTYFLDTGATRIRIGGGETIGRDPDCTVVLNDEEASRRHAVMRVQGEEMCIEDLGSRNGTYVNGQRISSPTVISVGDIVQIGTCRFEVAESRQARQNASFETLDGSAKSVAVLGVDDATRRLCSEHLLVPVKVLDSTTDLARMTPFSIEALLVTAVEVKREGLELLGRAHWYHPAMPIVVLAEQSDRPLAEALVAQGSHGAVGWLALPVGDDVGDKLVATLTARGGTTKLPERLDTLHPAYEGEERRACFRALPPAGEAHAGVGGAQLDLLELALPQAGTAGSMRLMAVGEVARHEAITKLESGQSASVEIQLPREKARVEVSVVADRSQRTAKGLSMVVSYRAERDALAALVRYWVQVQRRG